MKHYVVLNREELSSKTKENNRLLLDNSMQTRLPLYHIPLKNSCGKSYTHLKKTSQIFDLSNDRNWKNDFLFLLLNEEQLISNLLVTAGKESNSLATTKL